MAEENLLIVGASARAAAFSALRAGVCVRCADLFADADLAARCPVTRVAPDRYPHGFLHVPGGEGPGPWMYTGALENWPDLVDEISTRRPLWGNPGSVLRRVRSPREVARVLCEAGVPCPAVWLGESMPPANGGWVVKPLAGAGGRGVRRWIGPATPPLPRSPFYCQEYVEGLPCAAVYVGDGRQALLLGVTRQLLGEPWLHAAPFHYCGSVGPLLLEPPLREKFDDLGSALVLGFGLKGLFGVDCVLRDGVPWPVEVNPRYTASVEVLEYATATAALGLHRDIFEAGGAAPVLRAPRAVIGKAILFAPRRLVFPRRPWHVASPDPWRMPGHADIPNAGESIEAGKPILTMFAQAAREEECVLALRRLAADMERRLFGD